MPLTSIIVHRNQTDITYQNTLLDNTTWLNPQYLSLRREALTSTNKPACITPSQSEPPYNPYQTSEKKHQKPPMGRSRRKIKKKKKKKVPIHKRAQSTRGSPSRLARARRNTDHLTILAWLRMKYPRSRSPPPSVLILAVVLSLALPWKGRNMKIGKRVPIRVDWVGLLWDLVSLGPYSTSVMGYSSVYCTVCSMYRQAKNRSKFSNLIHRIESGRN